uniref:Secreted protein n=1 Tax=Steinernema glaseri TaxID=37863 RepID=A0A1I7Z8V1_9BILA
MWRHKRIANALMRETIVVAATQPSFYAPWAGAFPGGTGPHFASSGKCIRSYLSHNRGSSLSRNRGSSLSQPQPWQDSRPWCRRNFVVSIRPQRRNPI